MSRARTPYNWLHRYTVTPIIIRRNLWRIALDRINTDLLRQLRQTYRIWQKIKSKLFFLKIRYYRNRLHRQVRGPWSMPLKARTTWPPEHSTPHFPWSTPLFQSDTLKTPRSFIHRAYSVIDKPLLHRVTSKIKKPIKKALFGGFWVCAVTWCNDVRA